MFRIVKVEDNERDEALTFAEAVFDRSEASRYSDAAVEFFHEAVAGYRVFSDFSVFAAYKGDKLAGVLVSDPQMATICLLMVSESVRGCGVGSALVNHFLTVCNRGGCTVNAALSAVEFYRSLGFRCVGEPKEENGFVTVKMYGVFSR